MDLIITSDLKHARKPLLLQDYLFNDLSSCSSSGFKSYPRRQCSTNVRFLIDVGSNKQKLTATGSTEKVSSYSKLQKAYVAFLISVKRLTLPFPPKYRTGDSNGRKRVNLRRIFSMVTLRRSFWRRSDVKSGETPRWRTFSEFLKEPLEQSHSDQGDNTPSPFPNSDKESRTQKVEKDSKENETAAENEAVPMSEDSSVKDCNNQKELHNEVKEQFSPVSVLDNPFDDNNGKQRSKQKSRRIDGIARLGKRLVLPSNPNYASDYDTQAREEEEETEKRAKELLGYLGSETPTSNRLLLLQSDILLLDFFWEGVTENIRAADLLKAAEEWVAGRQHIFMGWEVKEKRIDYFREVEKNGNWRTSDESRYGIVEELETSIFRCLMEDLVLDLV